LKEATFMNDQDKTEDTKNVTPSNVKRVEEEMAIMAEIGRVISSTLQIEEIYDNFALEAKKLITFDKVNINLVNPGRETFTFTYTSGFDVPGWRPGDVRLMKGTVTEAVVNQKVGILRLFTNPEDFTNEFPGAVTHEVGIRSLICTPLIVGGDVIGGIHFLSKKAFVYTEQDLRLAERISHQIAGAIANATLYKNLVKTEFELRESSARYKAIFEQAAVGVAEVEIGTGKFVTVNNHLCEITGRTKTELLATTFLAITHPEDAHIHEEGMSFLISGAISDFSIEKRYLKKNGEIVWVGLTISALWLPGETPRNNLVIVQNITKRKQAEEEVSLNTQALNALLEGVSIVQASTSSIIYTNPAYDEMLGYERGELLGKNVALVNAPTDKSPEEIAAEIQSVLRTKGIWEGEVKNIKKDGTTILIRAGVSSFKHSIYGTVWLGIMEDITERRQAEKELRDSKELTERLVQEATIINEIWRKISSTLNIREVYERIATESQKLICHDRLVINRINHQEGIALVTYVSGLEYSGRHVGDTFPLAGSITEDIMKLKNGIIIRPEDETEVKQRYTTYSTFRQGGILSLLSVPLIWNDEVIGSLHFRSKKPNAYSQEDLRLAEGIGREIAGTIINAQLYTDLQKTGKALRESQEIYARLIDAIPDIVVQIDNNARIVFANEIAHKMAGYTDINEVRGRDILTFIAPEDRERAAVNLELLKRQKLDPQTYRLISNNSRSITAEINGNVLLNEDGSMFGNVLLCRDVTERNRIYEALQTSEAKYRFLTDNMNDMIGAVDQDLRMTYVNKSIEKFFGVKPEECIGRDLSEFCTPQSYNLIRKTIAEQLEIEKNGLGTPDWTARIEMEDHHKDGSTIWLECLMSCLRDSKGVLIGYHGVSRNITERKKLEKEVNDMLNTLENRVQERTIELEEVNTALRVLLKKGEQDLKKLGYDIADNIDQLVIPFLRKLKISSSIDQNKTYANIIETNLTNIISPFISQLYKTNKNLTPKEIQIAAMIKDGRSSKEIASIMSVSIGTITTHRNNIRKKLKLSSRELNLRTHLLTLS
jgi:PAS domain S-box-containing protein